MAFAGTSVWEVQSGGSDTANGGGFDPGQTAGMFADGTCTLGTSTAPVFASASYNFVAGDQNAYLYIASGTNWNVGWYKITGVSNNAATLDAATGHVNTNVNGAPSKVDGCATVATQSANKATWSIDYSQQTNVQFTYTDITSTGAGLTASSATHPFGKQQVGNSIVITGGTNFTQARYFLASVSGTTGTFLGAANLHTGVGTDSNGAGAMGGCLATPAFPFGIVVASNVVWVKAATYTINSASTNVAGGIIAPAVGTSLGGYQTYRGDFGTQPLLQASGISGVTMVNMGNNTTGWVKNIACDGATLGTMTGFKANFGGPMFQCKALNFTASGFTTSIPALIGCQATGCTTAGGGFNCVQTAAIGCEAYSNTVPGFVGFNSAFMVDCISYNNSGATTDGFQPAVGCTVLNCTSYNNGRDGFRSTGTCVTHINCIAEGNTATGAFGFNDSANRPTAMLINCAGYNNGTGGTANVGTNIPGMVKGFITGTSTFFTNAAGGDFSLNNNATGGKLARSAGTIGFGARGVFPAGTTTTFLDVGAAQHADPVGGTGTGFFIQ